MHQPIMEWNTTKKLWQRSTGSQLFELWEPYLETWPTEGTMRNGQVFKLQMQEHRINDSEFSSLPTPTVQDGKNNAGPSQYKRNTKPLNVEAVLLGTPRTSAAHTPTPKQVAAGAPKQRLEDQVASSNQGIINWGKFEPAIRRWEQTIDRKAPAPSLADGKDGTHRLSSKFTEWMMGLPEGWITACGLTRNEEIKACGNGVVPQQAELALRMLLAGHEVELKEDSPR